MKHTYINKTLGLIFMMSFAASPLQAAEYPPALNFDDFIEAVNLDASDASLYFGRKLLSVHVYVPGHDVQVRTDVIDSNGKILVTKERVHLYKNGQALGEINSWVDACAGGQCIDGPTTVKLAPGLYWMVFSEKGKIFSAEWFEIRSYPLGEGRFAKGTVYYSYLPQTQMARLSFNSENQLQIEAGFAGEKEVADQNAILKPMLATLKYNGTLFAKLPGTAPHKINLYPYTTLIGLPLSKAANNTMIQKSDLKDGNYDLEILLDGKLARKFLFQIKGGKFIYQDRQKQDTQPIERMLVSEKSAWLWNSLTKEPSHTLPPIKLSNPTSEN